MINVRYGGKMDFNLEYFSNDRFLILKLIYENLVCIKNSYYAPLSQQVIADMAHFSKLKTNKILKELLNKGYIYYFNKTRGKYAITNNGNLVLRIILKDKEIQL